MNYFYITGTSSGIGKAIADQLLKDDNNFVYGLARTCSIKNDNYEHFYIDLSDLEAVKKVKLAAHFDAQKVVLINNAGMLGKVIPVGKREPDDMINVYNVNMITPGLLMNEFIYAYKNITTEKIIINISSGAARHPVESWATYCASKAAVDMFSRVIDVEQKQHNPEKPLKIYSVAPGIVDTPMQNQIRDVKAKHFSKVDTFIKYKKENQLDKPKKTAKKIIGIIKKPSKYKDIILDVREF